MNMVLMFFDGGEWHIARFVQKSGLGIDIAGYCDAEGGNKVEQLPERVLNQLRLCKKCTNHEILKGKAK